MDQPALSDKALDISSPQVDWGLIVPDTVVVRFEPSTAAKLQLELLTNPDARSGWNNKALLSKTVAVPAAASVIRPFASGEKKSREVLEKHAVVGPKLRSKSALDAGDKATAISALVAAASASGPEGLFYLKLSPKSDIQATCLEMQSRGDVVYACPSPLVRPTGGPKPDTFLPRQWNLNMIDASPAWTTAGNALGAARVCVVDTGVRVTHSELKGRTVAPADVYPDDGNAYGDKDQNNDDPDGHGTACAGIIASIRDNKKGVAGIAPVNIVPVNGSVFFEGEYYIANYTEGVMWGVDSGASVVSLSLGGTRVAPLQVELDAAAYASAMGVLVCAASGNGDVNSVNTYPANISSYFTVGAVDTTRRRVSKVNWWWGSNYGSALDICAPGQGEVGTFEDSIITLGRDSNSAYINFFNGTSAATPHVAGLAGLLKHVKPEATAAQIRSAIETTANDQVGHASEDVAGWDQYHGYGLIDAAAAIATFDNGSNPRADLAIVSGSIFINDLKLSGSIQVSNAGVVTAGTNAVVVEFLPAIPGPAVLLKRSTLKTLTPGKIKSVKLNLKLPSDLNLAGGIIRVTVDPDGAVTERSEFNNVAQTAPL